MSRKSQENSHTTGLLHNNYWINVVRSCGQQVVFFVKRKPDGLNGGNAAKPVPPKKKAPESLFRTGIRKKQPANHIKKESEQFSDIFGQKSYRKF